MSYHILMGKEEKVDKQKTPKGHEISIPKREEFLRNLKKVAKPDKESDPRSTEK